MCHFSFYIYDKLDYNSDIIKKISIRILHITKLNKL